jgi:hypothetical protein
MPHKVPFLVAELGPDVDPFVLQLFAALAEKERSLISTRTRARARWSCGCTAPWVTLGNPTLHMTCKNALETVTASADKFTANVPSIREAQRADATTLRGIAAALNARGIATANGGQWHAKQATRTGIGRTNDAIDHWSVCAVLSRSSRWPWKPQVLPSCSAGSQGWMIRPRGLRSKNPRVFFGPSDSILVEKLPPPRSPQQCLGAERIDN